MVEITSEEQKKAKRMKRTEDSLRDFWDNIKCSNIHIIGIPVHGVAKRRTRWSDFTFMHWRRKWQPTPVFLPGESLGRGNLVGCRLWGHTESDKIEVT